MTSDTSGVRHSGTTRRLRDRLKVMYGDAPPADPTVLALARLSVARLRELQRPREADRA